MRVYAKPLSTNVERVALALGVKGLEAERVVVAPDDRTEVRRVSGQDLTPVLVDDDGTVVVDSPVILAHLEDRFPEHALWPPEAARRGELNVFVEWFNRVWKLWPNAIAAADPGAHDPEDARRMDEALDLFDSLLEARPWLFGGRVSAADLTVFPFVKQAALGVDDGDDERFHHVLAEFQSLDGRDRLREWIARVDALPRGL